MYVFLVDIGAPTTVRIGALGEHTVQPGRYAYVGSARRGLAARLGRHARHRKPLRWHIDYLRQVAAPAGAVCWGWEPERECALAAAIEQSGLGVQAIPRFGASDCGCRGHLLRLRVVAPTAIVRRLAEALGAQPTQVLGPADISPDVSRRAR